MQKRPKNTTKLNATIYKKICYPMIKWDLSQEYKVGSTSEKSINVVFQTKIIKNRNHIIISIEGERALDRT